MMRTDDLVRANGRAMTDVGHARMGCSPRVGSLRSVLYRQTSFFLPIDLDINVGLGVGGERWVWEKSLVL
jgi:hypothetical protein